jgi:hypothetical protein
MAESSSSLTFRDLLLKVAEYYGVASYNSTTGIPYIPADNPFNFRECKKIVNEAVRMFMSRPPRSGKWRWTYRTETVTFAPSVTGTTTTGEASTITDSALAGTYADDLFNTYTIYITAGTGAGESAVVTDYDGTLGKFTFAALSGGSTPDTTSEYTISRSLSAINGDGARYMLSAGCTQPVGGINYVADSSHRARIEWCDISRILQNRSPNLRTGYPTLAAIRPYQPTTAALGSSRRWEITFDPSPSSVQSIEFQHVLTFDKMDIEGGTATGGAATTLTDTSRTEADDYFNDWIIRIISGTGVGSYATVTDYVKTTGVFTVADWLNSDGTAGGTDPTVGSIYVVEPEGNLHPAGAQFDQAIKVACLAMCEMEAEDAELGNKYIGYFNDVALPDAHRIDVNSAPRTLGNVLDRRPWLRRWENVTYN